MVPKRRLSEWALQLLALLLLGFFVVVGLFGGLS